MATSSSENKIFLLILTRHGQTSANKSGIIQGQIDIPLNDEGESEAKRLGHALCNERFTHVYSSDLVRASTTAELASVGRSCSIVTDERLRERNFGDAENRPFKLYQEMAQTAGLPLHEYTPLNAETPQEFSGRVVDFFSDMCRWIWEVETPAGDDKIVSKFIEDHGEVLYHPLTASVMVACHGGTIRWFLYHFRNNYCQLPDKAFIRIPNTGLNSFIVTLRDGQCIKIKSITLQDLSHLQIVV